eukprot:IDg3821t1
MRPISYSRETYFIIQKIKTTWSSRWEARENSVSFARKAMVRTGMTLNLNGLWEEEQLFPNLQQIIARHRGHFNGDPVVLTDSSING